MQYAVTVTETRVFVYIENGSSSEQAMDKGREMHESSAIDTVPDHMSWEVTDCEEIEDEEGS